MRGHWLNKERLTNYPRIFLALYLVMTVALILTSHGGLDAFHKPMGHDFITFWAASKLALAGNAAAAYDVRQIVQVEWAIVPGFHTYNPWLYPPTFYLLVLPLSLLPYFLSYIVFMATTFAGYFVVLRKVFAPPGSLPLLLAFPGLFVNAHEGQNAFLTGALAGGALILLPSRPVLAGILIGLLTIKPQLGLLFPLILVCGRHWRAFVVAALTAAVFLASSVAVLGTDTLSGFYSSMVAFPAWAVQEGRLAIKIPSFFAFARLLGAPLQGAYILQCLVALPVAAAVGWVWIRCKDVSLRSAAFIVGSLLVTPYLLDYDLAWLALPIIWFACYAMRFGWLQGEREMLVAAWLLPLVMTPFAMATHVQIAPFVLVLFLLLILRRVRGMLQTPDAAITGAGSPSPGTPGSGGGMFTGG